MKTYAGKVALNIGILLALPIAYAITVAGIDTFVAPLGTARTLLLVIPFLWMMGRRAKREGGAQAAAILGIVFLSLLAIAIIFSYF